MTHDQKRRSVREKAIAIAVNEIESVAEPHHPGSKLKLSQARTQAGADEGRAWRV